MNNKKHTTIALVGAPNAGKSTLTNALLGQKLAIVSPRPQTTRNSIKGILTEGDNQIIIIDTPGIFIPRKEKILERIIVKSAWQGVRQADHICFLIDASTGFYKEHQQILSDLIKDREGEKPTVLINKIDLIKKSRMLEIIAKLGELGVENIIPISAQTLDGIDELKKFFCSKSVNEGWIYSEDEISDAPMRSIACEITREKIFLKLNQELPYSVTVKNESFKMLDNGDLMIRQVIFILKESQKSIIIGKRGDMIKQIGLEARRDISEISGRKVHLFLFVKVKEDWMNSIENFETVDLEKLPNRS